MKRYSGVTFGVVTGASPDMMESLSDCRSENWPGAYDTMLAISSHVADTVAFEFGLGTCGNFGNCWTECNFVQHSSH